jgi:hypothetical protein
MRKPGPNAGSGSDGGALALMAICGTVVAVALVLATFDRLGTLVPMARTVAVQAMQ